MPYQDTAQMDTAYKKLQEETCELYSPFLPEMESWQSSLPAGRVAGGATTKSGECRVKPIHRSYGLGPLDKNPVKVGPLLETCNRLTTKWTPLSQRIFIEDDIYY